MTSERWRKIEQLYHAALEGGRGVLAGVDPELKREVERLLAAAPTGQGLLDMPAAELLPESSAALPPTQPGPYVMVSKIGRGGMGEVWKARDSRLNRDVAIKISSEQFTDRFEREARSIAALNHSNICTLHDVGPNYLVMELVEGPTLAERMKRGQIPFEEALAIARQIAEALEAAHEKGIVHRDLKPANIKIRPDGSVKVLDFGIAKAMEAEEHTMPGMVVGTPGYMSPEHGKFLMATPVEKTAAVPMTVIVNWPAGLKKQ